MPFENLWEVAALGVDVAIGYLFYKAYRSREEDANIVSNALSYPVGDALQTALTNSPDKCIPYACIEGITEAAGGTTPLKSRFTDAEGVARHELFVEFKSKRTHGFWSDVKNVIKDVANVRPFYIVNPESQSVGRRLKVEVTDPLSADYFLDHLPVTYERYEQSHDGFLARCLDRLFGELTKGYQETEKILGLGVPITGFGTLSIAEKRIILGPPEQGQRYIITTMTRPEIVHLLRSDMRSLRICFWVCSAVGAAIVGFLLYRFVHRRIIIRRNQQRFKDLRLAAAATRTSGDSEGNQCVVCMSNPREVIILNCGHICLCSGCASALAVPGVCPMCRASIDRFLPIYVS